MNVLIIEDEAKLVKYLSQGLREEGYVVETAPDGQIGLEKATAQNFDFIILDVMMPKMDGLTLCRRLRKENVSSAVLMLTARDATEAKVDGLDAGADDYLTKPFSFGELLARLRALARRPRDTEKNQIEVGGLVIDAISRRVTYQGRPIEFTNKEFQLLSLLARRPGHVFSRTAIGEAVWGYDFDPGTNVIDVHINRLRKQLVEATKREWIETRRNQGYVFGLEME